MITWKSPEPGDIVWCNFPENQSRQWPGPKARPALVISVEEFGDNTTVVHVVPGTSQGLDHLYAGEATITRLMNPAAYKQAGLTLDTKFQFASMMELDWSEPWFKAPPHRPHGNTPKLGTLHASLVRRFFAAHQAVNTDES